MAGRSCIHRCPVSREDEDVSGEIAPGADTPDFAALYGTRGSLTPRMGYRLWSGALACGDTWRLAREDPRWLIEDLPPIARPWAIPGSPWLDRFVSSFYEIADRIAVGSTAEDVLTACTGDEMALHLVIDFAEAEFDSGTDAMDGHLELLPALGDSDTDFESARDALLRDDDVLMLFDPSLDGIDDPDSGYRTANLHPERWFLPFEPE